MSKVGKRWKPGYPDVWGDQLSLASQSVPAVGVSVFYNFSLCSHLCNLTETSSCSSLFWVWQAFRAFSLSFAKVTGLSYLHDTLGERIIMPSLKRGAQTQQNQSLNRKQKHTNDLLVFSWFWTGIDYPISLQCIFCWDAIFIFYDIVTSPRH